MFWQKAKKSVSLRSAIYLFSMQKIPYNKRNEIETYMFSMTARNTNGGMTAKAVSYNPLLVYPNPTQGEVSITVSETCELSILNQQGQIVMGGIRLEAGLNQLDVAKLPAGVYLLRAGNQSGKLVVID